MKNKKFAYFMGMAIFAVAFIAIALIVMTVKEEKDEEDELLKQLEDIEIIDLRAMSGQEMYDAVKELYEHPNDHLNSLVVASGMYHYHEGEEGAKYCYCILYNDVELDFLPESAIEFVPQESYWKTTEELKDGDIITVKGAFGVYEEDEMEYLALRNTVVNILVSKDDFDKNTEAAEPVSQDEAE